MIQSICQTTNRQTNKSIRKFTAVEQLIINIAFTKFLIFHQISLAVLFELTQWPEFLKSQHPATCSCIPTQNDIHGKYDRLSLIPSVCDYHKKTMPGKWRHSLAWCIGDCESTQTFKTQRKVNYTWRVWPSLLTWVTALTTDFVSPLAAWYNTRLSATSTPTHIIHDYYYNLFTLS